MSALRSRTIENSINNEAQPQDAETLSNDNQVWRKALPDWMPNCGKDAVQLYGNFGIGIWDTIIPCVLNIPALAAGGIGKASEAVLGGESMFTSGSKYLFDKDAVYKKASSDTLQDFNSNSSENIKEWSDAMHGAGTSVGFLML